MVPVKKTKKRDDIWSVLFFRNTYKKTRSMNEILQKWYRECKNSSKSLTVIKGLKGQITNNEDLSRNIIVGFTFCAQSKIE